MRVSDIEKLKQRIPTGHDCNRRLLQQGSVLLTEKPDWVWKHAQIHFIGKDFTALLYAGEKTNKFICQLDGADTPIDSCVEKGLWLWLRNTGVTVYEFVADNAATLVGVAAVIIPAIRYRH